MRSAAPAVLVLLLAAPPHALAQEGSGPKEVDSTLRGVKVDVVPSPRKAKRITVTGRVVADDALCERRRSVVIDQRDPFSTGRGQVWTQPDGRFRIRLTVTGTAIIV